MNHIQKDQDEIVCLRRKFNKFYADEKKIYKMIFK